MKTAILVSIVTFAILGHAAADGSYVITDNGGSFCGGKRALILVAGEHLHVFCAEPGPGIVIRNGEYQIVVNLRFHGDALTWIAEHQNTSCVEQIKDDQ